MSKPIFEKGDREPVASLIGKKIEYPNNLSMVINSVNVPDVNVTFEYPDASGTVHKIDVDRDLSQMPLTWGLGIGKQGRSNAVVLPPNLTSVSRAHGSLLLEGGEVIYLHEGQMPAGNPNYTRPPEMNEDVPVQAGTGGGYTFENRTDTSTRYTNEDRGLATLGPRVDGTSAITFLNTLIDDFITPATERMKGGSTLAIAMRTNEDAMDGKHKKMAVSFLADSPVYEIVQNPQTSEVRLIQMTFPHNAIGMLAREVMQQQGIPYPNPPTLAAMQKAIRPVRPDIADAFDRLTLPKTVPGLREGSECSYISKGLGYGTDSKPETFVFDPIAQCPQGFEYKGVLVTSDGTDKGIKTGYAEPAIQQLLASKPDATPAEISRAVVEASSAETGDNLTAVILPAAGKAGDMAIVADGNTKTFAVAEKAVQVIREQARVFILDELLEHADVLQKGKDFHISPADAKMSPQDKGDMLKTIAEGLARMEPSLKVDGVGQRLRIVSPSPELAAILDQMGPTKEHTPV